MYAAEILQTYLQGKNLLYLNRKNVLEPKVVEFITEFLEEDENHYKELRNNLPSYKSTFQYVYSNVFPEIYCSTEKRGFDLNSNFHIIFKNYKNKKQLESSLGKNPDNYEMVCNEANTSQQKPVNIDEFNEIQETEVQEPLKNKSKNDGM